MGLRPAAVRRFSRLSAVGLTWEYHREARQQFQHSELKHFLSIASVNKPQGSPSAWVPFSPGSWVPLQPEGRPRLDSVFNCTQRCNEAHPRAVPVLPPGHRFMRWLGCAWPHSPSASFQECLHEWSTAETLPAAEMLQPCLSVLSTALNWDFESSASVSPWLTAAIPMANPYCSCKLTRSAAS